MQGTQKGLTRGLFLLTQVLASSKQSSKEMAASSSGKVDAKPRLAVLKARLFRSVCRRVCKGLLNKDRLLFAVRLAQVNWIYTNNVCVPVNFGWVITIASP